MLIYWINCEWDLGFENMFFDSEEGAMEYAVIQIGNYLNGESFQSLKEENLISIERALVNTSK